MPRWLFPSARTLRPPYLALRPWLSWALVAWLCQEAWITRSLGLTQWTLATLLYQFSPWKNQLGWLYAGTFSYLFGPLFTSTFWPLSHPTPLGFLLGVVHLASQIFFGPLLDNVPGTILFCWMIQRASCLPRKLWASEIFLFLTACLTLGQGVPKKILLIAGVGVCFLHGLSISGSCLMRQFSLGILILTFAHSQELFAQTLSFLLALSLIQLFIERNTLEISLWSRASFFAYPLLFLAHRDNQYTFFALILYGILVHRRKSFAKTPRDALLKG